MKLILGTAQLGLDYGISNQAGAMPLQMAHKILNTAHNAGITTLDTAPHYGNAEARIGQFHQKSPFTFKVISKAPRFDDHDQISAQQLATLESQIKKSLSELSISEIDTLLVHALEDLQKPGGMKLWQHLKNHPQLKKTGVSIYTAEDIDWVLEHLNPDVIQAPFNVLDQRLLKSGHLKALKQRGIETHARSVFLQGLLLMSPEQIRARHPKALESVSQFLTFGQKSKQDPLNAALHFVLQQPLIDQVLVGVQSAAELTTLCDIAQDQPKQNWLATDWDQFYCQDPEIIDPRYWS